MGASDGDKIDISKLVNVGRKHGKNFLVQEGPYSGVPNMAIPPIFGLSDPNILFPMLKDPKNASKYSQK
jgi:hypothetical protein